MTSLSKTARVAGLLYILSSLLGLVRLIYIPSTLFASANATSTQPQYGLPFDMTSYL